MNMILNGEVYDFEVPNNLLVSKMKEIIPFSFLIRPTYELFNLKRTVYSADEVEEALDTLNGHAETVSPKIEVILFDSSTRELIYRIFGNRDSDFYSGISDTLYDIGKFNECMDFTPSENGSCSFIDELKRFEDTLDDAIDKFELNLNYNINELDEYLNKLYYDLGFLYNIFRTKESLIHKEKPDNWFYMDGNIVTSHTYETGSSYIFPRGLHIHKSDEKNNK